LPKLDGASQRTSGPKALTDHPQSRFIQIWPIEASSFRAGMRNRLGQCGLHATRTRLSCSARGWKVNLLAAAASLHYEIAEPLTLLLDGQLEPADRAAKRWPDSARLMSFTW